MREPSWRTIGFSNSGLPARSPTSGADAIGDVVAFWRASAEYWFTKDTVFDRHFRERFIEFYKEVQQVGTTTGSKRRWPRRASRWRGRFLCWSDAEVAARKAELESHRRTIIGRKHQTGGQAKIAAGMPAIYAEMLLGTFRAPAGEL